MLTGEGMLVRSAERENILVLVVVAAEGAFTVKPMGAGMLLVGLFSLLLGVLAEASAAKLAVLLLLLGCLAVEQQCKEMRQLWNIGCEGL